MENGRLKSNYSLKPEYLFLIIASFMGLAYALLQPLFIEPDSSYHFENTTYIANTVVDRSSLGFNGEEYQQNFDFFASEYRNGDYFKKFFETKIESVPKNQVQDKRIIGNTWQNNPMHIVPALGVKLAYSVYPSIGFMVFGGRIFNLLFFLVAIFVIIKYLKIYKLIFVVISLTPTVIQFATSLSYDCYNYIAFAFMTATLFNIIFDLKQNDGLKFQNILVRLIIPSIMLYFSKSNSKLLFLLVLVLLFYFLLDKLKIHFSKNSVIVLSALVFCSGLILFLINYHLELKLIIKKIFFTILEPNYKIWSTEVIGGTVGSVPFWFYGIQFVVLFLVLFSSSERLPKWFSWFCFSIFLLNLVSVNLFYAINPHFSERVITGPQGRYFTSFILLLAPISAEYGQRFIKVSGKYFRKIVIAVSLFALILNLSIISVKFYYLQVPSNRFRSDVNSMILK